MSRHRNVRSLNIEEEYEGYDDVYGHSVEDDYCVSPGTASQFLYDRGGQIPSLSHFMQNEQIPEEEEEGSDEETDPLQDSSSYQRPKLSDLEEAQLNSCLEQIRSVIGDSTPDHILIEAVIKQGYDYEKALDAILTQQAAPKPQRQPRNTRKSRTGVGGADWNVKTDMKLKDPPAPKNAVAAAEPTVTVGPSPASTRMTFTSNTKTTSGFTPEKEPENGDIIDPDKAAIEAIKRDLNLDDGDCIRTPDEQGAFGGEPSESDEMFTTPKKEPPPEFVGGSMHKSASKSKLFRVDTKKKKVPTATLR